MGMNYGKSLMNVFATSLRHRLNGNGIRAGVIRGEIPAALAKRFLVPLTLLKAKLTIVL